ncbi:MAG: amidohydrolase family protein [Planctomycetota bacterium]
MSGVVDIHHHIVSERGYVDLLLRKMDEAGVERAGLIGMGEVGRHVFVRDGAPTEAATEKDVARAVKAHPDRFFGYVFVRPGFDGPEKVRRWANEGFRGAKFHLPKEPYNHASYWGLYEAAQDAGLVCLFHTGVFKMGRPMPGEHVSSANCQPIHLDPVANDFPELEIVLAHMGVCWNDEAANLARLIPNVHLDISGALVGWRTGKDARWWKERLWWEGAEEKMLFGSDVHAEELAATLSSQLEVLKMLGWEGEKREKFLRVNAMRLFFSER